MICWRIELSELDSLDCKVTGKFTKENTKKEIVEHEVNTESTREWTGEGNTDPDSQNL